MFLRAGRERINFAIMRYLYIIEKHGKYYTGITTDLKHRMRQHGVNKPLYKKALPDKGTASRREREIKGRTRKKKAVLIAKFNSEFTLNKMK